jgi:hypothetical protein
MLAFLAINHHPPPIRPARLVTPELEFGQSDDITYE